MEIASFLLLSSYVTLLTQTPIQNVRVIPLFCGKWSIGILSERVDKYNIIYTRLVLRIYIPINVYMIFGQREPMPRHILSHSECMFPSKCNCVHNT